MKKLNILDIIVFLFVLLFVYAAANKVIDYNLFKAQIGKSPLIMNHSNWIAWFIPGSEILIAFALLFPRTQLLALYASFSLMFTFTAYIAFILTFSPYVPCSCGGILNSMGWTEHLIFNIGFTALAVVGIVFYNKAQSASEAATSIPSYH
jgi:uncharacterized membrane protein YphA (DoxX/SURF4 family)